MVLIYVNPGNSSVMKAQVISLLNRYSGIRIFDEIILLQGYKNRNEKDSILPKLKGTRYKIVWFKRYPGFTWFKPLSYWALKKCINSLNIKAQETILHVRGEIYGSFVAKFRDRHKNSFNLLVDIRGFILEEYEEYYQYSNLLKKNKQRNALNAYSILKKNIPITVVSESLKAYLISRHKFNSNYISVHSNIADNIFLYSEDLRINVRNQLNIDEDTLVAICSTGGGALWQKDRDVIEKMLSLDIHVINLSPIEVNIPGVINKFVTFEEVPSYLSAADIAVLWRDKSIINQVASPSKFSEFAVNGLFTIHNGTIDLVTNYINNTGLGIIIDSIENLNLTRIKNKLDYNRSNASINGYNHFGIDKISDNYIDIYKNIFTG